MAPNIPRQPAAMIAQDVRWEDSISAFAMVVSDERMKVS
jgi:hypothetical protein